MKTTCDITCKESLTKKEASTYLGVSEDFVKVLCESGKIDYYRHTRRRKTYSRRSLDRYLKTILQQ